MKRMLMYLLLSTVSIGSVAELIKQNVASGIPSPSGLLDSAKTVLPDAISDVVDSGNGKGVSATIVSVTDGDTVKVRLAGDSEKTTVRLIGIDTPETHKPGVKVECGGKAASENAKRLLPPGKRVRLAFDPSQDRRDRYDRLLAYVDVDGTSVQKEQLKAGLAAVYVFKKDFQRVDEFNEAADEAKRAHRGVYGACPGSGMQQFHSEQRLS